MMQWFHITSIKDARVVEAREMTSVAGRARFQKTQLEGEESVQWALEAHLIVEHLFYSANLRPRAFLEMLQARGIACYAVSDGILKKISDTSYLVPVIGVARLPAAPERSLYRRRAAPYSRTGGADLRQPELVSASACWHGCTYCRAGSGRPPPRLLRWRR